MAEGRNHLKERWESEDGVVDDFGEIKSDICYIKKALDTYIKHAQEVCELKHKEINQHLKESPVFRDRVVKTEGQVTMLWILTVMLLSSVVGGFFWLLRR